MITRERYTDNEYEAIARYIAEQVHGGFPVISSQIMNDANILPRRGIRGINSEIARWRDSANGWINDSDNNNETANRVSRRRVLLVQYGVRVSHGGIAELRSDQITPKPKGAPRKIQFMSENPTPPRGTFTEFCSAEIPNQEAAGRAILQLVETWRMFHPYLCVTDNRQIQGYLNWVRTLYQAGGFTLECKDILRTSKWGRYNVRYGARSIYGVVCEVYGVGLINRTHTLANSPTQFRLNSGSKYDELKGADAFAYNPNWTSGNEYVTQIKAVPNLENFKIPSEWLTYNRVDRLLLVDLAHNKVIHVRYAPFCNLCAGKERIGVNALFVDRAVDARLYKQPLSS
jgi:hypothetical protein